MARQLKGSSHHTEPGRSETWRGSDAALADVRDLLKAGRFSEELRAEVIAALEAFDPTRKIRFRSSTNVEDSASFVGAGLYDSFSGCLGDDMDDDEAGPSICDSDKENERGVFRAIRRVFASFYNRNAYIERLKFGIDESQVGMAVLAHYSFPTRLSSRMVSQLSESLLGLPGEPRLSANSERFGDQSGRKYSP